MASASEIVAAIDAAILTCVAAGGVASLSVGGRSVSYNLEQLQNLREFYGRISTTVDTANKVPFKLIDIKTSGANK